ncbi:MAG: DUF4268 domain-containing protein, partial [Planctomycetes bacterium]|nr:DUF4268 domain-containing protein [Planctomycetota bacterium]
KPKKEMETMIGKVSRKKIREVWPHEAHDFTKWLADNIQELGDTLGFDIEISEREGAVGTFSVDLVGSAAGKGTVIIENQYGKSDHDHLGKLLTYAFNRDAQVAVWVVEDARPEHAAAISRLNEMPDVDFYIVKVEAITIDNSPPAALFTLISAPSKEIRDVGRSKAQMNVTQTQNFEFWEMLLRHANSKSKLHSSTSPSKDGWIAASSGLGGVYFNYVLSKSGTRVDLYMMRNNAAENKAVFDNLLRQKEQIEREFGTELFWQRLDDKIASRISFTIKGSGRASPEIWESETVPSLAETMIKFHKAVIGPLKEIRL